MTVSVASEPLRRRALLSVIGLILLVTAAVILFVIGPQRRRAAVEMWRGRLSAMADDRKAAIERWIDDAKDDATLAASFPAIREILLAGAGMGQTGSKEVAKRHLESILTSVAGSHHCRSVWVLDGEGHLVACAPGSDPIAPDEAEIGRRAAAGNVRALDMVNYDGSADIIVAAPVPGDAGGRAAGSVVLEIDPEGFVFPLLRTEAAPTRTAETLVVRGEGEEVLYLSPLRFRSDQPGSYRLPASTTGLAARAAVAERETFGNFVDYRGVPVLAAIRSFRNAPWGLVAKVDVDEALSRYREEVIGIAVIFGLMVVSLSGVGFAFWRRESVAFESSLAESRARYASLLENAADPICFFGPDGTIREVNSRAEEFYGWNREELIGRNVNEVLRPPGDPGDSSDIPARVLRDGTYVFEAVHAHRHGTPLPVEVSATRVEFDGQPLVMSIVRDIRDRKEAEERIRQLNRLLRTISEINQLIVRTDDRETLLSETCRVLVEHGGFRMAWVGVADHEKGLVVPAARAGEDSYYLDRITIRFDETPEGRGPVGTAVRTGRHVVVADLATEPAVAPWRERMLAHGFRTTCAFPFRVRGEVAGTLTVYSAEPGAIGEEETALLDELVNDLGHALSVLDDRERLRQSEARQQSTANALQAVVAASPLAIFTVDYDARVGMWNPAAERIFGWSEDEVRGRTVPFVPEGLERVFESLRERVRRGESLSGLDVWLRRKDGSPVDVSLWTAPLRDADGQVLGAMVEIADIAERKRAEETLRAAEERYRTIFETAGIGIAHADAEGRFVDVNPAFCRIVGRGKTEIVGKSWADITYPDDLARNQALYDATKRGETDRYQLTKRFLRGDGSPVLTNVLVNAVADKEGIRSFIGLVEDVTEKTKLEERFRQAQKMEAVGRLAGGVAHDFNNLLTVITGYSELLSSQLAPKSQEKENLTEIEKAAERATGLTRQLLAFSRQQVLQPKAVDLNEVVSGTEKMLRRLIGEDVEIVTRLASGPAVVIADRGQIEQVLMNLAVNARDAMPKGGRLTIEVSRVESGRDRGTAAGDLPLGRWVAVTVTDTGHGIPPEVKEHLFEPFFTTKETGKGTGLGLATVYGIVKQSGGRIWVENAPGGGATFRAIFPRSDARLKVSDASIPVLGGPRGTETILLVEDEPSVRGVARSILAGRGYRLIEAENGAAALDLATRHSGPIHLVLTDVVMPGMGGREVVEKLLDVRPDIRVLFVSGYAADKALADDLATNGHAYLSKPFSPVKLAEKVREVLDAPARPDDRGPTVSSP